MKLYKNVSIFDLEKILKEGILPISKTGNDNWDNGRRANNSREVVYLFDTINPEKNVFTRYGAILLEVEVEKIQKNTIAENDVNRGQYEEYITDEVKPDEIKKAYIPKFLKRFIKFNSKKIKYVEVKGNWRQYNPNAEEFEIKEIDKKIISKFENIDTYYFDAENDNLSIREEIEYISPVFGTKRKGLYGLYLKIEKYII